MHPVRTNVSTPSTAGVGTGGTPSADRRAAGVSPQRILIVDDDDDCRAYLAEAFEALGCHVRRASDAGEALRALRTEPPDLVCSDLRMPGMDGLEFLALLRAHVPDLRCVVVSACADASILSQAHRLGVVACLRKPVPISELVAVLARLAAMRVRPDAGPSAFLQDPAVLSSPTVRSGLDRLDANLLHKTSQLSLLTQFSAALCAAPTTDPTAAANSRPGDRLAPLVRRSLDIARRALAANQATLGLLDHGTVRPVEALGVSEASLPLTEAAQHLAMGTEGEPWHGTIDGVPLAAAALVVHGERVGVLCVGRPVGAHAFGMSDADLLAAFAAQTAVALENASLGRQLEQAFQASVASLIVTLEAKHKYTEGHSMRVAEYARGISVTLGLSVLAHEQVHTAALLHDLGKVGIRDEVLDKPGDLTAAEWAAMREHPQLGARILGSLGFLTEEARIVRHHHERLDGSGYPDGLTGEDIPLAARIIGVADAFDAMRSARSYRRELSEAAAIDELRRGAGTQFDPDAVEAFCAWCAAHSATTGPSLPSTVALGTEPR
jgi:putative nucleotidyltransferase with HDIG domain